MATRIVESERNNSLLDYGSSSAVFHFIETRTALPLSPKQSARDRRPTQYRGASEMKNVMKTVAIRIMRVIRQFVPILYAINKNSHPFMLFVCHLKQLDFELSRQALALCHCSVKAQRILPLGGPALFDLREVCGGNVL